MNAEPDEVGIYESEIILIFAIDLTDTLSHWAVHNSALPQPINFSEIQARR
jgi:hypothetical protein